MDFNYRQVTSTLGTDSMNTLSMLSSVRLFIKVEQSSPGSIKTDTEFRSEVSMCTGETDGSYLWTMDT